MAWFIRDRKDNDAYKPHEGPDYGVNNEEDAPDRKRYTHNRHFCRCHSTQTKMNVRNVTLRHVKSHLQKHRKKNPRRVPADQVNENNTFNGADQFPHQESSLGGLNRFTEGVIARMKEVLRGHDSLRAGFNIFLPEGYEM